MTRVAPEDGRVGDIWRVEGKDHEMVVDGLTKHTITLNSVNEPQPSGWGYDLDGWDDVLYRIREDLTGVAVGDRVHLYVPETEVYLVKINIDTQWPSLSGWFGFQTGRQPEPDADDEGLFFHPSADENLVVERVFRPYAMLESTMSIVDAEDRTWAFEPPFRFEDEQGAVGVPTWPLTVVGDADKTAQLNETSHPQQLDEWTSRSGVDPSVYEIDWSSQDD